jgi:hypothetical protein
MDNSGLRLLRIPVKAGLVNFFRAQAKFGQGCGDNISLWNIIANAVLLPLARNLSPFLRGVVLVGETDIGFLLKRKYIKGRSRRSALSTPPISLERRPRQA